MRNRNFLIYLFLIILLFVGVSYCLILGESAVFWALLSKVGYSGATRAIFLSFLKLTDCSGRLALVLFFAIIKALNGILFQEIFSCMEEAGPSSSTPSSKPGNPVVPPEKSALDDRKEELLLSNIIEKKGDLADGQRISDVRRAVEADFNVSTTGQEFELIKEIQKEAGTHKEDCPATTNSALNQIREYQSNVQDRREDHDFKRVLHKYSTGVRDPPG